MRLLVINNTSSGIGDGAIFDYLRMFLANGDEACLRTTDGTTHVEDFLADAADFDAVVVAGGDGTVTSVAHALKYTGIPILPFPAGTANLLVNNLQLPLEPHSLSKLTRDMRTLDFDLGVIEAAGRTFGFGIMAGAGYDAAIMSGAKPRKKLLGSLAYFQAAVANPMPQKSKITLVIDGRTIHTEGLAVVLVNFPRIQFEIPVTHSSNARDGEFDVAVFKAENAFGLIPALVAATLDRDGSNPDRTDSMEIYHGKQIEVYADPPFEIEYDGETPGVNTPFRARVLERAARFIVTEAAYEQFSA